MLIQVLGTGCAKCTSLAIRAEEAARQTGMGFTLEKVKDMSAIIALGAGTTPALIIDGKLKCAGNLPSVEQIVKMLKEEHPSN